MFFLSFALFIEIKKNKKNKNNKTNNQCSNTIWLPKLAILEKELNGAEQKQYSETSNSLDMFFLNFTSNEN